MKTSTAARRITLSPITTEPRPSRINRIVVRTADYVEIIPVADIAFVQADGSYCTFVLRDGSRIMASRTLKQFQAVLETHRFLRPHQSYMVNVHYVRRVRKIPYYAICMDSEVEIPLARSRRTEILAALTASAMA